MRISDGRSVVCSSDLIGAFALLIVYHVGMVFVPWGFHVKTEHPLIWAEIPMFLTSPWRLTLLFVVSGYASRALIGKMPGIGAFLRQRSGRLLWPLLFGQIGRASCREGVGQLV